ncbi:DUF6248 family natural product biosynthesis protein [Actinophytocola sediminis]
MSPTEAEWVREHVWPKVMRQAYKQTPAYFHDCACKWGMCGNCARGDCKHGGQRSCTHQPPRGYAPFPSYECTITNRKWQVLALPDPFHHPHRTAIGWHRTHAAMVWLADRRCIWSCPCPCRTGPAAPQPVVLVATRPPRVPPDQLSMFDVIAGAG